jgi:ribose transport system substrate-binding protein
MRSPRVLGLLACLALAPALSLAAAPAHIAVISRADNTPFWQAVRRGAMDAARDLGVTVTFTAPAEEPLADAQARLVEDALAARPAALCIDALDSAKVLPLLLKARRAGIPVIGFDRGAAGAPVVTTAGPDNAAAAALAANKLAALLGGVGTVGLVVSDSSSRASVDRRDGFLKEMRRRYPRIHVTEPSYSGGDPKAAADAARLLLQSQPGLGGLFAADEGSAAGVLSALSDAGTAARVVVVGFDSGAAQVEAVRSGLMAGAVTRDPVRLGYRTVQAAVDALDGRRVPAAIDTGFHWYDRTNIDDPSIAAILHD